jgi:hypothetical protein
MSLYYRSLIQSGSLLDLYPNARIGYSLRKLRDGYTGNPIRVRRGIDSTEQDIPFLLNGNLDTTNVEDFCGYNLATFSQDIANAAWTKTNLNITGIPPFSDVAVAPDGTTTADKMIDTIATAIHRVSRTLSAVAGRTYNISVYLKAGERRYVQIQGNITGANQIMNADLQTGTILSNTFSNANLVSVGSGWYRFDYTSVAAGGSTSVLLVSMQLTSGGSITYLGDGLSGMFIWGYQLSQASSVKTYQITTNFAGGSGFIATWYDQSGNGFNAIQGTANSQCQIVLNNNIIIDPDNSKISTLWAASWYSFSSTPGVSSQKMISAFVFNRVSNATNQASFGNTTIGGRPFLCYFTSGNAILTSLNSLDITTLSSGDLRTGDLLAITQRDGSNVVSGFVNGAALVSTGTQVASTAPTTFGRFTSTGGSGGYIQEAIWWNQDYLSARTGIETNINTYYAIY